MMVAEVLLVAVVIMVMVVAEITEDMPLSYQCFACVQTECRC